MPLDLLTLKSDGSHTAGNALSKLRDGSHAAWADEVGTVERHKTGRVSIHGAYSGYRPGEEEGDSTAAGVGVGALTGGLLGLIGGPAGSALGLVGGGALGGMYGPLARASSRWLAGRWLAYTEIGPPSRRSPTECVVG